MTAKIQNNSMPNFNSCSKISREERSTFSSQKFGMASKCPSVFIQTFGCQMNSYDSELIAGIMSKSGYKLVSSAQEAGVIIFNTCSVRKHAEDKFFSNLGRLQELKDDGKIFCVAGCTAKKLGEKIFSRAPYVDIIFSPANLYNLPKYLDEFKRTKQKQLHIEDNKDFIGRNYPIARENKIKAMVAIMQGCDNFCSYCVVPYARGREISRPAKNILAEVKELAGQGYKEVMLLGQNVNSYCEGQGSRVKGQGFVELLEEVNTIEGIKRIRFMTSHPKDVGDKLLRAIKDTAKVCEHIHLPVQSGSDKILAKMNRGYTAEHYLNLVDKLRRAVPDIAITTDLIVGFPGETARDFQATLRLMKEADFDAAYTFKYSSRPGTAAAEMDDDVPAEVKKERLEELSNLQEKITGRKNAALVGKTVEVLAEGQDKKNPHLLSGLTRTSKVVKFKGDKKLIGELVKVKITTSMVWSLEGELIDKSS
jgi:tRNA-2-methylthio-N6-dimethylallyladenosine synthase